MKELEIIKKLQTASDEMLRSLKEDTLEQSEKRESFGYIRGVRDCAYDIGVLEKTNIQEQLLQASKLLN